MIKDLLTLVYRICISGERCDSYGLLILFSLQVSDVAHGLLILSPLIDTCMLQSASCFS